MNDLERLELRISKFLRFGVILAGILIAIGWGTTLQWTYNPFATFDYYDRIPFPELLNFYWRRSDWSVLILYLGLFILISLPIIRVLLTGFLFMKNKERILGATAFFVFLVLVLSFFLGLEL